MNNPRQITEAYFNLTSYYTEQKLYQEALVPAHATLEIAKANNLIVDEVDAYDLLKEIYNGLGDKEQAANFTSKQNLVKLKLDKKQVVDVELIQYLQELSERSAKETINTVKTSKKTNLDSWYIDDSNSFCWVIYEKVFVN